MDENEIVRLVDATTVMINAFREIDRILHQAHADLTDLMLKD
jgi:cell division GTPase FtsZ